MHLYRFLTALSTLPDSLVLLPTALGGVVFGLALAAPPGPMNAIIAEESALRGWRAGFRAGLGAMTADACFFVLALAGVAAVVQDQPGLRRVMIAVGGLLMLWFAYGAVRDANALSAAETERESAAGGPGESRGFTKAFVLALTNPYQIAFWLTVGIGLLEPGTVDVLSFVPTVDATLAVQTGHPVLVAGLFGGIVVWITGFPAAIVAARRRIERAAPLIAWASAAVLAGSGLLFLGQAF